MAVPLPIFFLFFYIYFHSSVVVAQQVFYRAHSCINASRCEPSRSLAFQANLNLTLLYLNSNSTSRNGFFNVSSGNGADTAYGIFLCRGDISPQLCRTCINETSRDIINRCPNYKEAIIWYDECMLRFSNRSIFSRLEQSPTYFLWNPFDVTNPVRNPNNFNRTLGALMNLLVPRGVTSENLYATGDVSATSFSRLYGLVQCTPDISRYDCSICLSSCVENIPNCCNGKRGGRVLMPSCGIRFEIEAFYYQPPPPASLPPQPPAASPNAPSSSPSPPPPPTAAEVAPPPSNETAGGQGQGNKGNSLRKVLVISIPTAVLLLSTLCYVLVRWNSRRKYDAIQENAGDQISTVESIQVDLSTIQAATNNFSDANKIGEGGFGPGTLPNGQKIAVKRLSKSSNQGGQEFKNEVDVVVKLQHRNLVRLLGFCLHGQEKILIYEYVTNKSLNYFLFHPEKQLQLDWPTRTKIIKGVSRGLLYLHEDSRLRIIHRDLKAGNVLLDENMNAKISDFGMARIFGVDQTEENTNRIVGTFGYMPPEYAMYGQYSVKSDVFSFGVLVLEIISSKKNSSSFHGDYAEGLLSYAWRKWKEGSALELVHSGLRGSCPGNEVTRCIHVALLCVQEDPTERPTMATVVHMLSSFSVDLPLPKRTAFFAYSRTTEPNFPIIASESSINEASITEPYPR